MRSVDKYVLVTMRVKVVGMVKAAAWLEGEGVVPRSRNDIIQLCVDTVAALLEGGAELGYERAHEILDEKWPVKNVVRGQRVRKEEYARRKAKEMVEARKGTIMTEEERKLYETICEWDRTQGKPVQSVEGFVMRYRENRRKREQLG